MKKQQFTWNALERMAEANPDQEIDLFSAFTFDHLEGAELDEVIERAAQTALYFKTWLAYAYRLLGLLTRLKAGDRGPKADVFKFIKPDDLEGMQ